MASLSPVAEPAMAVMIEHFLSMKARICAICRLVSLLESEISKSLTRPLAL